MLTNKERKTNSQCPQFDKMLNTYTIS